MRGILWERKPKQNRKPEGFPVRTHGHEFGVFENGERERERKKERGRESFEPLTVSGNRNKLGQRSTGNSQHTTGPVSKKCLSVFYCF